MTTAGTSLLLRSATKYLGVSKYHAMAEVGPSHAESSSQRSAASFASFSQPLSQHSSQDERPPSSARAGAASARACKAAERRGAARRRRRRRRRRWARHASRGAAARGRPGRRARRLGDKVALLDATSASSPTRGSVADAGDSDAQAQAQQALPALVETQHVQEVCRALQPHTEKIA